MTNPSSKEEPALEPCEWCKTQPETWAKPGEPHTAAVRCINLACPVRKAGWVSPGFWNTRVSADGVGVMVDSIDPIGNFVERVWALTSDRDGWSRITLRGLVESFARQLAVPRDEAAQDQLVDEVQHRMDHVVEAAVDWHQNEGNWAEEADRLSEAIESLLELRDEPGKMPRRRCAVHNREEFKYESLEHELHAAPASSQPAREAAREIADYVSDGILGMGNEVTEADVGKFFEIISRHLPAAETVGPAWQSVCVNVDDPRQVGIIFETPDAADMFVRNFAVAMPPVPPKPRKPLPTIAEISGSINFGGRVIIDGDDQYVVDPNDPQRCIHCDPSFVPTGPDDWCKCRCHAKQMDF